MLQNPPLRQAANRYLLPYKTRIKLNSIIKYNQVFMKKLNKTVNIILLSSFFVSVILSILLYIGLSNEIGDITYDASIDNKNFVTQGHIYQYYQSGAKYKNERAGIRDEILNKKNVLKSFKNGYITARFVINSQGQTDRYRLQVVNLNYEEKKISQQDKNEIIKQIKSLKYWIPGVIENQKVDSYSQINFKIQDGKIVDIF